MIAAQKDQTVERHREGLLLIESDFADATRVLQVLIRPGQHDVEWVKNLTEGLNRLQHNGITGILLDLNLPDSRGIETLDKTLAAAGNIPILALCPPNSESIGRLAVEHGAHDFLSKDHLDQYTLTRALRNMRQRRLEEDTLCSLIERAEVTLNSIGDGVLTTDVAGHVTYMNPVAENMTGWTRLEAVGRPLTQIFNVIDAETRKPAEDPLSLLIRENRAVNFFDNNILIRRDGYESPIEDSAAPIHDRAGEISGAVIVCHDISDARRLSTQLSHLAQHDYLTDLPNRMLVNDRLQQAISLAQRHGYSIAVMFLDLDRFKHVNDSLGHGVGDQLLQAMAMRLERCVRRSDTVGRLGGDEFVVILSELSEPDHASKGAGKLLAALTAPYHIGSHELHVSVSVGVSIFPNDGADAETLINNADTAMYHAKENGRNNFQFYTQEMNVRAAECQFIEEGLRGALERNEFCLHYQSKMNLETKAIAGVEAFLRWRHPERGFIQPAEFIPIAENSGLIVPIGRWVLREACRQARAWIDEGLPPVLMAVNISAVEFRNKDFVETVSEIITETKFDPAFLELELTESVLMHHAESTVAMLNLLKSIGVRLTIDDFGTGYSSLSYLRKFPVDALKVDQSFVHEISSRPDDAVIVSAVISMGNSLNKRVIAEGVETHEQLEFLTCQ